MREFDDLVGIMARLRDPGGAPWVVRVAIQTRLVASAHHALHRLLALGGLLTRLVTLQLSVALTVKVTLLRLHRPASAVSTRLLEQVSTGF